MKIEKYQKMMERIDQFIRLEATGSPNDFANIRGISKSTLYDYLKCLKEIGADIYFDNDTCSFKYGRKGKLNLLCFEIIEK
jgi:hypothetical protein